MPTNFIRIIAVLMYVSSFFLNGYIAPWNNLPATSEHFSSLSSFKYLINSTDFLICLAQFFNFNCII